MKRILGEYGVLFSKIALLCVLFSNVNADSVSQSTRGIILDIDTHVVFKHKRIL